MRRAAQLAIALAALAACGDDAEPFPPGSYLDDVRVLGIRAEPPDVAPGQRTRLSALVYDPGQGSRDLTYLWVVCDPDPHATSGSACVDLQSSRDPAAFLTDPPEGVRVFSPLLGLFDFPIDYTPPARLFEGLPENDPARVAGLTATVMLVIVEGSVIDGSAWRNLEDPDLRPLITLKRIRVADPGPDLNRNPRIETLRVNGVETADAEIVTVRAGENVELSALAADGSQQTFTRRLPDGGQVTEQEPLVYSWFTTDGRFDRGGDASSRTNGALPIRLQVPDLLRTPYVDVYAVLRDARGGIDWKRRRFTVEQ